MGRPVFDPRTAFPGLGACRVCRIPTLLEMFPDAWKRFHGAVHMMAKASPQHRPAIGKFKAETGKAPRRPAKKVYRHQ